MNVSPYDIVSYFQADLVSKIDYFAPNMRAVLVKKDSVLTIMSSDFLSELLPIILMHVREVRRQSSSNACQS